jgi:pimeloyl-ACP methyl ester carboxylesterase
MEKIKDSALLKNTNAVQYKNIEIDGLNIFYREAGSRDNPTILLLHGFPSSSHMYRNLIPHLSSSYHLIAPDYPGFGLSTCLSPDEFEYSFDNLSEVIEKFIDKVGLLNFSLYMHDYGGPVGFRIASRRPKLIQSLIIQNANVYADGLGPEVQKFAVLEKAKDNEGLKAAVDYLLSFEGIKEQYVYGAENIERISPDSYWMDHFFMERNGSKEIQSKLFQNYNTNFPKYPEWQAYLKKHQPLALIVWGKNDKIFTYPGAEAYKRDIKKAELYLLNGGHFLLEEHSETVAEMIIKFLIKNSIQGHP